MRIEHMFWPFPHQNLPTRTQSPFTKSTDIIPIIRCFLPGRAIKLTLFFTLAHVPRRPFALGQIFVPSFPSQPAFAFSDRIFFVSSDVWGLFIHFLTHFSLPLHFLNSGKKIVKGIFARSETKSFARKWNRKVGLLDKHRTFLRVEPFLCQTGHIFPRNQLEIRESRKTRGEEERFTKG